VQALLQHTPSAEQIALWQSVLALHVFPLASFEPQALVVLRQVSPETQSVSTVQVVRHEGLVALHLKGSQACVVAAGQCPAPSQFAAEVSVLPVAGQLA